MFISTDLETQMKLNIAHLVHDSDEHCRLGHDDHHGDEESRDQEEDGVGEVGRIGPVGSTAETSSGL